MHRVAPVNLGKLHLAEALKETRAFRTSNPTLFRAGYVY
jgi:hypothetical protein